MHLEDIILKHNLIGQGTTNASNHNILPCSLKGSNHNNAHPHTSNEVNTIEMNINTSGTLTTNTNNTPPT